MISRIRKTWLVSFMLAAALIGLCMLNGIAVKAEETSSDPAYIVNPFGTYDKAHDIRIGFQIELNGEKWRGVRWKDEMLHNGPDVGISAKTFSFSSDFLRTLEVGANTLYVITDKSEVEFFIDVTDSRPLSGGKTCLDFDKADPQDITFTFRAEGRSVRRVTLGGMEIESKYWTSGDNNWTISKEFLSSWQNGAWYFNVDYGGDNIDVCVRIKGETPVAPEEQGGGCQSSVAEGAGLLVAGSAILAVCTALLLRRGRKDESE